MADPDFFTKVSGFTVSQIAELTGCRIHGVNNPDLFLENLAPLDKAGKGDLAFFDNVKYRELFKKTKASACFIAEKNIVHAPENVILLVSPAPYTAYARAANAFYPDKWPNAGIRKQALVDSSATIGPGCIIEDGVIIKAGAIIGENCWIESGAIISEYVKIGDNCRIGMNATVSHCHIGNAVRIYAGVRIGQDGFGFAVDKNGFIKVPQLGRVIIGDHCEIGANTTIDRGAGPDTIIGAGTWIDNLVQIGHNVKTGKGCIIVSQVGISGSTELGDYVVLGGQAGIAGHLKIGSGARIGAQTGVIRDIPAGVEHLGMPSVPSKQFMRQAAILANLAKGKLKR